ncbi:MAG: hypothetical protein DWQ04_18005 [Chloroflexi bacterium]|nr:MAG: hypothetical protein DWQ04_18005 [Chloroflexota bacterium]
MSKHNPFQLADSLGKFVKRSGYTAGQLAKLSGIPKPTIVNWMEGRVRRPRGVEDLLRLTAVLHLTSSETSTLLESAGHPAVNELRESAVQTGNDSLLSLLSRWENEQPKKKTAVPFQAMADLPYFVGRDQELSMLKGALQSGDHTMLVSLQGMGGVGKTVLAAHVAYQLRNHFADGVLWARLNGSDVMSILATFAGAFELDVSQYADVDSRSRVVRELLAHKRILIVLDNVNSSEQVKPLLPPTGTCAVLITTRRHDLSITRGSHRIVIGPFRAEQYESLALFSRILGEARVRVERPLLTELANFLGNLPLAVDIAAGRLAYEPGWSTADFLKRVRQEHRRLGELSYEDQSVRASFNASFEALSPKLQQFFAALGLFTGDDFSDEAAAFIAGISLEDAQDQLRQLFAISLVYQGRGGVGIRARYRLHLLLRDYARNQLEDDAAIERFVHFYLSQGGENGRSPVQFDLDQQQIITALHYAVERKMQNPLVKGVNRVYPFWESRGLYETAVTWLTHANKVIDNVDEPHMTMMLAHHNGRLAQRQGEYIQAETQFESALTIARELKDDENLSHILRALGILAARRGDYVLADAYYKEGLALARALGYGSPVSNFLRGLGVQAYMQGNFARAEAFYEEGLALMWLRDVDEQHPRVMAGRLWGLGFLSREQQDFAQAETYYQQALQISRNSGHLEQVIVLLRSLAGLFWEQEKYEQSFSNNSQAVSLSREIGHRWLLARSLREMGEIQLARKQIDDAKTAFDELYKLARIMQSQELIANALFGLARVTAVLGTPSSAIRYAQESLDTFIAIGHYQVNDVQNWLNSLPNK